MDQQKAQPIIPTFHTDAANEIAREISALIRQQGQLQGVEVVRVSEPFFGILNIWLANGKSITVTASFFEGRTT